MMASDPTMIFISWKVLQGCFSKGSFVDLMLAAAGTTHYLDFSSLSEQKQDPECSLPS